MDSANPEPVRFSPSLLCASLNQTLETAYGSVIVIGEISNMRVSKNRWVYFDIKDDASSLKCFGTVYQLPGPLEDGLLVEIVCAPRLHPLFGFSLNISSIRPVGEGSLKRASDLLLQKLVAEGLFDPQRKRSLPSAPEKVGIVTSIESAAYSDFVKVLNERWGGVRLQVIDALVQGSSAPGQISSAIEQFNQMAQPPEVLVITRGGGSADDLAAFNDERVVRAVAASRIPTLVAIGHERDISLAEMAADQRASTPTNAVQLLVPDKTYELARLQRRKLQLAADVTVVIDQLSVAVRSGVEHIRSAARHQLQSAEKYLRYQRQILLSLDPRHVLKRGYALLRKQGRLVRSVSALAVGQSASLELTDGTISVVITEVSSGEKN